MSRAIINITIINHVSLLRGAQEWTTTILHDQREFSFDYPPLNQQPAATRFPSITLPHRKMCAPQRGFATWQLLQSINFWHKMNGSCCNINTIHDCIGLNFIACHNSPLMNSQHRAHLTIQPVNVVPLAAAAAAAAKPTFKRQRWRQITTIIIVIPKWLFITILRASG